MKEKTVGTIVLIVSMLWLIYIIKLWGFDFNNNDLLFIIGSIVYTILSCVYVIWTLGVEEEPRELEKIEKEIKILKYKIEQKELKKSWMNKIYKVKENEVKVMRL